MSEYEKLDDNHGIEKQSPPTCDNALKHDYYCDEEKGYKGINSKTAYESLRENFYPINISASDILALGSVYHIETHYDSRDGRTYYFLGINHKMPLAVLAVSGDQVFVKASSGRARILTAEFKGLIGDMKAAEENRLSARIGRVASGVAGYVQGLW